MGKTASKMKKVLKFMVFLTPMKFYSVGTFFDSYFAQVENALENDEIWDEYILDWEETKFNNQTFFCKITRENVGLTIEANLLLGE